MEKALMPTIMELCLRNRPAVKKNTSATALEETFPFDLGNKLYDTFQNGNSDLIENKGFVLNAESSDTFERIVGYKAVLDAASPLFFTRIVIKNKSDSDIRENNIEKTASEIALKVNILMT